MDEENYKKSQSTLKMVKKEFLEGIIVGIAIGLVISKILRKGINKIKKVLEKIKASWKEVPPQLPQPLEPFIYLSQLNSLLMKFNLSSDRLENFSKLRENLQSEGRKRAIKYLMDIIKSGDGVKEKGKKILEGCKALKEEQYEITLEPPEKVKKEDIPKIYSSIIGKYIEELGLNVDTQKNFEEAIKKVLNHIYHLGIMEILDRFKVELRYLEEGVNTNNIEDIEREIENIKKELEQIKGG